MSRRRRKRLSRNGRIFILIVILTIFITIGISSIAGSLPKANSFDWNVFWIVTFILVLIALSAVAIVFSAPTIKGKMGEARVSRLLKRLAKKHGGYVFNDVVVPDEDGKTSQIDHIYVSHFGTFVVETKNYAGRIYGTDDQMNWKQVLAYGNCKNDLYNPVMQNRTHIKRLEKYINTDIHPISVVVFVKANVNNVESNGVYRLGALKQCLCDRPEVMGDSEIGRISTIIMELKNNPVKTSKQHAKDVKQMKKDIEHNICPMCGGQLVERLNKNGKPFIGCSNYPTCRFIKGYAKRRHF